MGDVDNVEEGVRVREVDSDDVDIVVLDACGLWDGEIGGCGTGGR